MIITIRLADTQPNTYFVEYKDKEKYYSGTFLESSLASSLSRLMECVLNGKDPSNFGFCPF
jgi:hypothetical protein